MKAVYYTAFGEPPVLEQLPDPVPGSDGVVLAVKATGLCRSDWHGWMGHDKDIELPHVPGHELVGEIVDVGAQVRHWKKGDRVTVPFVGGCGRCPVCQGGNQQVCPNQFQPGFTHWGSFADFVAINYADTNLVAVPPSIDDLTAAALGCRFATAFRAVVDQGKVQGGQWVAVFGCGGVGLSAIMIAIGLGSQVIGVDIDPEKLEIARSMGATHTIDSSQQGRVAEEIKELTKGGAHVSLDALGLSELVFQSISCLRRRGKHIQVGLLAPEEGDPEIPMGKVIAHELEIYGSHGMQAWRYPDMLEMIISGKMEPSKLIRNTISLEESIPALMQMNQFKGWGMQIIDMGKKGGE